MLFKPGDIIEKEEAFTAILDLKEKRKRCDFCFEEFKNLKRCSKCKVMYYCGQACQKSDWLKGHKYTECNVYQICNAFKKQDPKQKTFIDYDTPRLLLRLYLYAYYNPHKQTEELKTFNGARLRSLDNLMEHEPDVRAHKDRIVIFEDIKLMFEEVNVKYDEKLLFRLFCKMYINGFSIMNSMLVEVGRAIYLLASQFDHSCVPNAITQFHGSTIEVRAIQEIDTEKQEIFVSYLNVMEKIDKRQEILARGYYFKCRCERCVFELKHYSEIKSEDKLDKDSDLIACKCNPVQDVRVKNEVKDEVKAEIKVEVKDEVKAEVKPEVKNEIKEAKAEVKEVLKETKDKKTINDKQSNKKDTKQENLANVKSDKKDIKSNIKQTEIKKTNKQKESSIKPVDTKKVDTKIDSKQEDVKKADIKPKNTAEEDWQQVKKTRNQKGKKSNSKPTTPEPTNESAVDQTKKDEKSSEILKKDEPKKPDAIKSEPKKSDAIKSEPKKPDTIKPESIKIIETKVEEEIKSPQELPVEESKQKELLSNQPNKKRQNSRSPVVPNRNLLRSPMPRNKMRNQSKSPNRNRSKSPQPNKQAKQKKKETAPIKTPPPTRFVPYTDIERECLDKFDELNKQFTEKVEKRVWLEAYDLAKQLYKCYLTYYRGDYSAEITLHLIQMLQIKRNILREQFKLDNEEVADLFNQLKKNILVTHGTDHNLYRKDYLDLYQTIEATTKLA